jgi:Na+/serine symporter
MFLTAITDYEDLGLKSLLIATIISMGFVIRYLHTSKESALNEKNKELLDAIKAKDDKILEVIKPSE